MPVYRKNHQVIAIIDTETWEKIWCAIKPRDRYATVLSVAGLGIKAFVLMAGDSEINLLPEAIIDKAHIKSLVSAGFKEEAHYHVVEEALLAKVS